MTDALMTAIVFAILGSLAILVVTILGVFFSLSGQMNRAEERTGDSQRRLRDEMTRLRDEMTRGEKRIHEETTRLRDEMTRGEKRISDQIRDSERRLSRPS